MDSPSELPPQSPSNTGSTQYRPHLDHEVLRRTFVGANYDYYAKSWKRLEQEKRGVFWNWAAFFLGLGWMAYRKMYSYAWIFIAIIAVEVICEMLFKLRISNIINIGVSVAFGSQGTNLYLWHVEKRLRELAPNDECNEEVRKQLEREGGTNIGAGLGFVVIVVLVGTALGWVFGSFEQAR
jgi:hypothetical protein